MELKHTINHEFEIKMSGDDFEYLYMIVMGKEMIKEASREREKIREMFLDYKMAMDESNKAYKEYWDTK